MPGAPANRNTEVSDVADPPSRPHTLMFATNAGPPTSPSASK
jgi:hypothetical protein